MTPGSYSFHGTHQGSYSSLGSHWGSHSSYGTHRGSHTSHGTHQRSNSSLETLGPQGLNSFSMILFGVIYFPWSKLSLGYSDSYVNWTRILIDYHLALFFLKSGFLRSWCNCKVCLLETWSHIWISFNSKCASVLSELFYFSWIVNNTLTSFLPSISH